MISVVGVSLSFSSFINSSNGEFWRKPITCYSLSRTKIAALQQKGFRLRAYRGYRWSFSEVGRRKGGILVKGELWRRKKRVVLVRFNKGFGFNGGGGGGGGGRDNGSNARVLGNLAFAIGLTYLSMTGQLNWLLDALFSIWMFKISGIALKYPYSHCNETYIYWVLLAVVLPIVGLGAFLWWAGRDIVQSSCPNCGNDFQIFKSTLNDELQLCPFCSQPFSVVDDKFVKEPVKFSNQTGTFKQSFNGFSRGSKKGKGSSSASIVDVEAEIKDAD